MDRWAAKWKGKKPWSSQKDDRILIIRKLRVIQSVVKAKRDSHGTVEYISYHSFMDVYMKILGIILRIKKVRQGSPMFGITLTGSKNFPKNHNSPR